MLSAPGSIHSSARTRRSLRKLRAPVHPRPRRPLGHILGRFYAPLLLTSLVHFALWRLRLADATTQTTRAERDTLAKHAARRSRLVEIGVWHGVTTKRLRAAMPLDAELWGVDPYVPGRLGVSFPEQIARAEVATVENGSVRWIRATGAEAASLWRREGRPPADFLFIDGDHSFEGISSDWGAWNDLIAIGGIVALHDSRSTPKRPLENAGSVRFTQETILVDPRFRVVDEVDSLTVLERVG
jgi:predicted O-methyltransferase YrrM